MIIPHPYIAISDGGMARFYDMFDNYARQYNDSLKQNPDDKRKPLKAVHREVYNRLIRLYAVQVRHSNIVLHKMPELRAIDSASPPSLRTNRVSINRSLYGSTVPRNVSTIHRYVERLMEAGVIVSKVNHGPRSNYELFINPDLMLISDMEAPDYYPASKFLSPEKQGPRLGKIANQEPFHFSLVQLNNKIIPVDKVVTLTRDEISRDDSLERNPASPGDYSRADFLVREVKFGPIDQASSLTLEENAPEMEQERGSAGLACAEAKKLDTLDWMRDKLSRWFFHYLMARIFANRPDICQPEKDKALLYVQEYYFADCLTREQLDKRAEMLKWRVEAIERNIKKTNKNTCYIYPTAFLDLTRVGKNPATRHPYLSFANTREWWVEKVKKTRYRESVKMQKQHLGKAIDIAAQGNNINSYKKAEAYVKRNAPYLMKEFYSYFS